MIKQCNEERCCCKCQHFHVLKLFNEHTNQINSTYCCSLDTRFNPFSEEKISTVVSVPSPHLSCSEFTKNEKI